MCLYASWHLHFSVSAYATVSVFKHTTHSNESMITCQCVYTLHTLATHIRSKESLWYHTVCQCVYIEHTVPLQAFIVTRVTGCMSHPLTCLIARGRLIGMLGRWQSRSLKHPTINTITSCCLASCTVCMHCALAFILLTAAGRRWLWGRRWRRKSFPLLLGGNGRRGTWNMRTRCAYSMLLTLIGSRGGWTYTALGHSVSYVCTYIYWCSNNVHTYHVQCVCKVWHYIVYVAACCYST